MFLTDTNILVDTVFLFIYLFPSTARNIREIVSEKSQG